MTDHRPASDDVPGAEDAEQFVAARAAVASWLAHALQGDAAGQAVAWADLLAACDELIPANLFVRLATDLLPMCAAGAVPVELVKNLQAVAIRAADDDGSGIP